MTSGGLGRLRSRRVAMIPLTRGIRRSISTTSTPCLSTAAGTSSPSARAATIVIPGAPSCIIVKAARTIGSSSTTMTRTVVVTSASTGHPVGSLLLPGELRAALQIVNGCAAHHSGHVLTLQGENGSRFRKLPLVA
jgi:hypothetical protein